MLDGISGTDFNDHSSNDGTKNEGDQNSAADDRGFPIVLNQLLAQMNGYARHVSGKDVVHGQRADDVHIAGHEREHYRDKGLGPLAPRISNYFS